MRELHLDVETFSALDLTDVGAHKYFDHPSTDLWCAAYSFDMEEPQIWIPGKTCCPGEIDQHIRQGGIVTAWNAAFERLAWRQILEGKYWWPRIDDEQFRCTMTEALGMAFPAKLEKAAPALGTTLVKDDAGRRLMLQMCRPRKINSDRCAQCYGKGSLPPDKRECPECYGSGFTIHKWDDEARKLRLYEYCKQDVRVEAALGERLLRLRPSEAKLYYLDMRINDRGVMIDKDLCQAAGRIVQLTTEDLNWELRNVTDGSVSSVTAAADLKRWLEDHAVFTDSLDREHVEDLLILDLPDDCLRALEIRQEGNKTSVAKIEAMLTRRQADGRMRGNLQFYGAGQTGRWAARGAQLQNLTRPVYLGAKREGDTGLDVQIERAIEAIYSGHIPMIEMLYEKPMQLVSDCVRSMIVAPPGKDLMSSDFSNIEGRCIAWEAGQEDKLDAFRAYDDGSGPDLYLIQASAIYNCALGDAKPHRQIGKVAELSLGYQGGPKAFAKMAKNYGVRIAKLYGPIWDSAEQHFKDKAEEAWEQRGRATGMSRDGWLASEVIKLAWRAKNYRIVEYWDEVEMAVVNAVAEPGLVTSAGKVRFKKAGSFLFCLLPSGRGICYPYAKLKEKETPWGEMKRTMVYKSVNQFTKQWEEKGYYGGLGVENITQAIARDIMGEAMLRIEDGGYPIILTVHDEIISEIDEDFGSLDHYNELMTVMPQWAAGLPISVGGWRGKRYRKG